MLMPRSFPELSSAPAASAAERRCCHSTNVFSARVTKASRVSTDATAKLAAKAYSLYRISTCSGRVLVSPRM